MLQSQTGAYFEDALLLCCTDPPLCGSVSRKVNSRILNGTSAIYCKVRNRGPNSSIAQSNSVPLGSDDFLLVPTTNLDSSLPYSHAVASWRSNPVLAPTKICRHPKTPKVRALMNTVSFVHQSCGRRNMTSGEKRRLRVDGGTRQRQLDIIQSGQQWKPKACPYIRVPLSQSPSHKIPTQTISRFWKQWTLNSADKCDLDRSLCMQQEEDSLVQGDEDRVQVYEQSCRRFGTAAFYMRTHRRRHRRQLTLDMWNERIMGGMGFTMGFTIWIFCTSSRLTQLCAVQVFDR
eukprot:SAG31_NODE_1141_length_9699_cov_4.487604_1_plen_289_part_00